MKRIVTKRISSVREIMKKLLLNVEWYWIGFYTGFYCFITNYQWWKHLLLKNEDSIPNIYSEMFWAFLSGEDIEIISYDKLTELKKEESL